MKIIIVSDTHRENSLLAKIVQIENADYYIHAGDSEASSYELLPFVSVKGNCDSFPDFDDKLLINTPYGKLLIRHKPPFWNGEYHKFAEQGIKVFIHGHTHKRRDEIVEGVRVMNPGSLTNPRDGNFGSYILCKIDKNNIEVIFKTIS